MPGVMVPLYCRSCLCVLCVSAPNQPSAVTRRMHSCEPQLVALGLWGGEGCGVAVCLEDLRWTAGSPVWAPGPARPGLALVRGRHVCVAPPACAVGPAQATGLAARDSAAGERSSTFCRAALASWILGPTKSWFVVWAGALSTV